MDSHTTNEPAVGSQEDLRQMELAISWILRSGVLVSAAFILVGAILFLVTGKSGYSSDLNASQGVGTYTQYHTATKSNLYFPTNPGDIFAGLVAFKAFGIIAFGLLLLILTPILRVTVSVFTFALEKDWLYVIFTIFVLVVLIVSFFLGKAGG